MTINVSVNHKMNLRRIPAAVKLSLRKGMLRAAEHLSGEIRIEVMRGGGTTGQLARSWRSRFVGIENGVYTSEAYSELIYAAIQNRGGTIEPRTQKMLAVPLRRIPIGKWPRHFGKGELRLIKSKKGNLILAQIKKLKRKVKGSNVKITPFFVLKRSVEIQPKHYVKAALDRARKEVMSIITESINAAFSSGAGDQ